MSTKCQPFCQALVRIFCKYTYRVGWSAGSGALSPTKFPGRPFVISGHFFGRNRLSSLLCSVYLPDFCQGWPECAGARSMAHNFVSRKISGVLPSKCWCKAPKLHVDMCQAIRNAGTNNWNDTMRVWCQYSEKLWWVDPEFPPKVTLRWTRSALVQRNQLTSHFGP